MPHFKAKMLKIRFPASVRPSVRSSLRWRLTLTVTQKRRLKIARNQASRVLAVRTDFFGVRGFMSIGGGTEDEPEPEGNISTHSSTRPCISSAQTDSRSTATQSEIGRFFKRHFSLSFIAPPDIVMHGRSVYPVADTRGWQEGAGSPRASLSVGRHLS